MDQLTVWTFSIVRRGSSVLSYRLGRYRNDHDTFANKRTIGFPGVVNFYDCTLFSDGDYGAADNALEAILSDLDISAVAIHGEPMARPKPLIARAVHRDDRKSALMVTMDWRCPDWFEPTTRGQNKSSPKLYAKDERNKNLRGAP